MGKLTEEGADDEGDDQVVAQIGKHLVPLVSPTRHIDYPDGTEHEAYRTGPIDSQVDVVLKGPRLTH